MLTQLIGISCDKSIQLFNIPKPDYIKIDVDGIEHLILKGAEKVIEKVQGILVEVNEDFGEQSVTVRNILTKAGLKLKEKKHSEMFDEIGIFSNTYNQIWCRN